MEPSGSPSLLALQDPRWRRPLLVALFLGLLYYFRSLATVLICFVVFERGLGLAASFINRKTGLARKGAVSLTLGVLAVACAAALFFTIGRLLPIVARLRADGGESLRAIFEHPQVDKLRAALGLENEALSHGLRSHAGTALDYVTSTAHVVVNLLVGFVLAVFYLYEREALHRWLGGISTTSVPGTIARWFGYVADAVAVTVRMQVVVAVVSAVLTLPVLLLLRLPHIPVLCLVILVGGLVPIVGNFASGVVTCYVAYSARGPWAVGVFLGVTLLLGKIESYYLNPRLAAQHVQLPAMVLIVALVLCEQAFGFVGLFISFPLLYVGTRIANEWSLADAAPVSELAPAEAAGGDEPEAAAPVTELAPAEAAGGDEPEPSSASDHGALARKEP